MNISSNEILAFNLCNKIQGCSNTSLSWVNKLSADDCTEIVTENTPSYSLNGCKSRVIINSE